MTFNPAGAAVAGSLPYWKTPEDVTVYDFSIATGTACVGCFFNDAGAVINGSVIRYANQLNTLAKRGTLAIKANAGALFGAVSI